MIYSVSAAFDSWQAARNRYDTVYQSYLTQSDIAEASYLVLR
ncbi:hypothetical protein [Colwellia piezophila]|nr:hypothetical protein [Colwellia piezophila]